jgi:glycosyltransferase involved in cell wall biosynthesis
MAALACSAAKELDVLVAAPEGYLTSTAGRCGVRVEILPLGRSRPVSWLKGSARLTALVWRDPPFDVIHANGLSALNLIGVAALVFRIPVLVHFHHHTKLDARARTLARMWIALGVEMLVCPVSKSALQTLRDARLHCIGPILPNTLEELPNYKDRDPHEPTAIGFLGSPLPRKGLHLLAEIAVDLRELDVQWLIYGIDPDVHDDYVQMSRDRFVRAGLSDRVVWGGKISDPNEAYERMDILLVPSLEESWCRVAMEGMAAGLPVVGTAIPGLSELLGLVEDAPMFPVDCPEEAAAHLRKLAGEPALRATLGRRGQVAVHPFDVASLCPRLLSLYSGLLVEARKA